ncbi:hypothetical protein LI90_1641 [Carbonactinospora thermoautotrophica]|uniref:Uncharacterized protein n=1 Tax=Carbonactinospora thermoautotrophica TaxID=1469144 RepID=A0A132MTA5_9ACTN|nr:hypothetical protein LI90_1641 [Carbonactinospora thermoautotrophica]
MVHERRWLVGDFVRGHRTTLSYSEVTSKGARRVTEPFRGARTI